MDFFLLKASMENIWKLFLLLWCLGICCTPFPTLITSLLLFPQGCEEVVELSTQPDMLSYHVSGLLCRHYIS